MFGSRGVGGGCVAWLALLVACAALWVSWTTYRRTGGNPRALLGDGTGDLLEAPLSRVRGAVDGALHPGDWGKQAGAVAEARARLLGERAEVEAHRNLDRVEQEVEKVRADLDHAFADASGEVRQRWQGLDHDLSRLQAELGGRLREEGGRALQTLDEVLDKLRGSGGPGGPGAPPEGQARPDR